MYYYPRIYDLREECAIPQKDVAEVLKISVQQYSLYERGNREIPLHHAIALAKFYNVSLDYIVGLSNNKNK